MLRRGVLTALLLVGSLGGAAVGGERTVRVAIQFEESGRDDQDSMDGSGSIVVTRRGGVAGSGSLDASSRTTTTRRSSGVFTLVSDGGTSSIRMATRVPAEEVSYFFDYATGAGYVARDVRFENVGTSLRVHAQVLEGERIRLRLTPEVSYFSADGAGTVELTDAATELVVRSGEPMLIGGGTRQVNEATRRVLGIGQSRSERESSITLKATLQ